MKKILLTLSLFLFAGCQSQPTTPTITNFQDCEQNGGIIMESYPRQCRVDFIDKTFVEKVRDPWDENDFQIIKSENTTCETKNDCITPPEYMIRSNCPYSSRCIDNECFTVCPEPFQHYE